MGGSVDPKTPNFSKVRQDPAKLTLFFTLQGAFFISNISNLPCDRSGIGLPQGIQSCLVIVRPNNPKFILGDPAVPTPLLIMSFYPCLFILVASPVVSPEDRGKSCFVLMISFFIPRDDDAKRGKSLCPFDLEIEKFVGKLQRLVLRGH
jgi:hypothetical protein